MLGIRWYPDSTIWCTMVGTRESIFKIDVLSWFESAILILVFANAGNTSFSYRFFCLLRKHCVAFKFSKATGFDNVVAQFYLKYLKLKKMGV